MNAASHRSEDQLRHANRVVAIMREEVGAHRRLHELLGRQEASVTAPGSEEFRDATIALEAELARAPHRVSKRTQALADLAEALGVARGALPLGSAAERLGDDGAALALCREELSACTEETRARTLRVSALVRLHRDVTRELLQVVLGAPEGDDVLDGGTLIDAEV
ncbi:MAG: hypothetical protein VX460_05675 [Planctomycetota bacterium]|nr:hypothetical protein [Planctomycetota bacterium]